ncbi:MAG TPA: D-alanyl-D-alanine dipeptidase [Alphaproteobacteria bacterium]|nr:D-alanyl-D-alanine dipeptidase [Alphaproteobacteria bacterium]
MKLVPITASDYGVEIDLAYARPDNFTGRPVYRRAACYLHEDAAVLLGRAVELAASMDLKIKIFDAFRPTEAQWALWNHTPDSNFLADPKRGSPHSRGVAVDVTLIDHAGDELDMGTDFDDFSLLSHHGAARISAEAQGNRMILLGIMTAAGWDYYRNEWWHYQMFDAKRYPLVGDSELSESMM